MICQKKGTHIASGIKTFVISVQSGLSKRHWFLKSGSVEWQNLVPILKIFVWAHSHQEWVFGINPYTQKNRDSFIVLWRDEQNPCSVIHEVTSLAMAAVSLRPTTHLMIQWFHYSMWLSAIGMIQIWPFTIAINISGALRKLTGGQTRRKYSVLGRGVTTPERWSTC